MTTPDAGSGTFRKLSDEDIAPGSTPRKAPPRVKSGTTEKDSPKTPAARSVIPAKVREQLVQLYTAAGSMMYMRDEFCGEAIIKNAEDCTDSLIKLAEVNPKVRKALISLIETSGWTGVLAAHAPILFAIYSHHAPRSINPMRAQFDDMPTIPTDENGFPTS